MNSKQIADWMFKEHVDYLENGMRFCSISRMWVISVVLYVLLMLELIATLPGGDGVYFMFIGLLIVKAIEIIEIKYNSK